MKRIACALLVAATCVHLLSCQKNVSSVDDGITPDPVDTLKPTPIPITEDMITTSVMGKIVDENNQPMKDATVRAGGKTTATDEYGIFRIKDINVSRQSTFITVEKSGYFKGSRTINTETRGNAFIRVKMLKKILKATIEADAGSTVTISGGATVTFNAGGFRNATGEIYHGNVQVYGTFYDPARADFDDIMPGALRGLTVDRQSTALKSYGMLNVVMETESGQILELSSDKHAYIKMAASGSSGPSPPLRSPSFLSAQIDS